MHVEIGKGSWVPKAYCAGPYIQTDRQTDRQTNLQRWRLGGTRFARSNYFCSHSNIFISKKKKKKKKQCHVENKQTLNPSNTQHIVLLAPERRGGASEIKQHSGEFVLAMTGNLQTFLRILLKAISRARIFLLLSILHKTRWFTLRSR